MTRAAKSAIYGVIITSKKAEELIKVKCANKHK